MIRVLWICSIITASVFAGATTQFDGQESRRKPVLTAPTYYLAVQAQLEDKDLVRFRGASNLPLDSRIGVVVTAFEGGAWHDYSDQVCLPLSNKGLFSGELHSQNGVGFRTNLVLRAYFQTNLCTPQPNSVLQRVGKKGDGLANVPDGDPEELAGLSDNPQLYQVSGWYYGLEAIARVQ